jgi:hypothetical protein
MLGSYLSDEQIKILRLAGLEAIHLALDDDEEGYAARDKTIARTQQFFKIFLFNYPPKGTKKKQDPQDLKPEHLQLSNFTEWSPI